MRRLRRWFRIGALVAVIGLIRLARAAWTRWPSVLLLAGAVLTVAGISVHSGAVTASGLLALLAGVLSPSGRGTATESARRSDVALVYRR